MSSTKPGRWVPLFGVALMGLFFYAMLAAVILLASLLLLQRDSAPDIPWIATVQKFLYKTAFRSVWQTQVDCVDFDERIIYKPKLGSCQFNNIEFKTTLNFAADGRYTGQKPAGVGIAVLGDSHAMGWGVADEETFAAELQRLSHRPVFNLAVSSYGTVRELERFKLAGVQDKVDTVIIQYCENDLEENVAGHIGSAAENQEKFATITRHEKNQASLLPVLTKAYKSTLTAPFKSLRARQSEKNFSNHYEPLMAVLQSHEELKGKRVIVMYSNANGQRFRNYPAGKDARLPHVEFVDLGLEPGDYYRLDDHLTAAGHQVVAQRLWQRLKEPTQGARQ